MLKNVVVGIGGAGGLGSNCAIHLLRSGFVNFVIYDFDRVEMSNLNRQYYFSDQIGEYKVEALRANMLKINPSANIDIAVLRVDSQNVLDLFKNCDVIIEAFDSVDGKRLMLESFMSDKRLFVSASGMGGYGGLDKLRVKKLTGNNYMVGDFETEISVITPSYSPRVGIVAAMEADVVLTYYKELENDK